MTEEIKQIFKKGYDLDVSDYEQIDLPSGFVVESKLEQKKYFLKKDKVVLFSSAYTSVIRNLSNQELISQTIITSVEGEDSFSLNHEFYVLYQLPINHIENTQITGKDLEEMLNRMGEISEANRKMIGNFRNTHSFQINSYFQQIICRLLDVRAFFSEEENTETLKEKLDMHVELDFIDFMIAHIKDLEKQYAIKLYELTICFNPMLRNFSEIGLNSMKTTITSGIFYGVEIFNITALLSSILIEKGKSNIDSLKKVAKDFFSKTFTDEAGLLKYSDILLEYFLLDNLYDLIKSSSENLDFHPTISQLRSSNVVNWNTNI